MRCLLKFGTGKFQTVPRLELSSNLVYPAIRYVQNRGTFITGLLRNLE